jgi:hypothetical protein
VSQANGWLGSNALSSSERQLLEDFLVRVKFLAERGG